MPGTGGGISWGTVILREPLACTPETCGCGCCCCCCCTGGTLPECADISGGVWIGALEPGSRKKDFNVPLIEMGYQMLREPLACTPETCGCCYCSRLAESADISGGPIAALKPGRHKWTLINVWLHFQNMEVTCMCILAHVSHDSGRRRHMQVVRQS